MSALTVYVVKGGGNPLEVTFKNADEFERWKTNGATSGLVTSDGSRECINFDELKAGETYYVGPPPIPEQLDAARKDQERHSHGQKEEMGRSMAQQRAGMTLRPDLCVIRGSGSSPTVVMDAVAIGADVAFIGSHRRFVDSSKPVFDIAWCATTIRKKSADGVPSYAPFVKKEIVPYFMAETTSVESEVQEACDALGVKRLVRTGTAIGPVTKP